MKTIKDHKAVVRRFFDEVVAESRHEVLEELVAPTFVEHNRGSSRALRREEWGESIERLREALPDFVLTIDDLIAEADRVVVRWTCEGTHLGEFLGHPPTERRVSYGGMEIMRFEEGRIVEVWVSSDWFTLKRQIEGRPEG